MTRRFAGFAAPLAALAFAVAGCANAPVVGNVDVANSYSALDASRYGSGGNEIRVEVHGDPFGAGLAPTAEAAVAAMQKQSVGPQVNFALDPAQEARPPSRVLIFFNPRQLVGAESLCNPSSPITTAPAGDGPLRVSGAWCQTNYVITRADARIASAEGLDSPQFRAVMGDLTRALFPARNPNDDRNRRLCFPNC